MEESGTVVKWYPDEYRAGERQRMLAERMGIYAGMIRGADGRYRLTCDPDITRRAPDATRYPRHG